MIKVLHILDSLNRGGAETLALDVCRHAEKFDRDWQLTFAATGGGDLEPEFRASGVAYARFDRRSPVDLRVVAQLRRLIRERGVQIVHAHQAVEATHAYLATVGLNVKRVLSFHLGEFDRKNEMALRFLAPRVDANVAVSRDLLGSLREQSFATERNFHVLYNGVDAHRLHAGNYPNSRPLRQELNVADDETLFGMVGNFYPGVRKDHMTVCAALVKLFDVPDPPRARFAFVGARSPAAPHIYDECVDFCARHELAGRVHFLGGRADVPRVLASLDVFVLSSLREGLPVALIEAMLSGVPAVISDIPALIEATDDGRRAAVFRTRDADDLARHMKRLIDDDNLRRSLAAAAYEWAAGRFGIEAHVANLIDLYRGLLRA